MVDFYKYASQLAGLFSLFVTFLSLEPIIWYCVILFYSVMLIVQQNLML